MPGYYQQRAQRPMVNELPPTPPGSGSGFTYSSMPYAQDPYAPQHALSQVHPDSTYDYQHNYMQSAVVPAPSAYQYPQSTYPSANSLPPIQTSFYEPMAPILPPLRMHQQHAQYSQDFQRQFQPDQQNVTTREQQQQANKDEKASGGVSAKLDYDMERMTDFVTEATQSIFRQRSMHPSFRKWVHQVLSATRLPSATILLSLHYLNDRVENFPATVARNDENHFYRLLAVSLILGSKFLDDNTFINRSWSDVTSIKVSELNMLEMKWLHLINYELHVDPANGLNGWIDAWKKYDSEYLAKQQPARPSPLNTNLRHHTSNRDLRFSPYPAAHSASGRTYESTSSARSSHFSTPYSASDPWSAANERQGLEQYYKRHATYPSYAELEDAARRASEERARQSAFAYSQSAHPSYYPAPTYGSGWDQSAWSGVHRYDCGCASCAYQQHYRPYPMTSSYAAQTVMG